MTDASTDTPTNTSTDASIGATWPTADTGAPALAARARHAPVMLAPLGYRDYRLLFIGQLISSIGNTFYSVALPWYMLTQGGGPINLGLVLTAYGVPLGVTTLLGGWLSDKLRARRVMLIADLACAVVTGGLAWATFGAHAPLWLIGALAAAMGAFEGLFAPASQAIAPDLLPESQLQAANGLFYAMMRLAQLLGPSVAGFVVARATASDGFAIDAATFVASVMTLILIRNGAFAPASHAGDQGAVPTADVATSADTPPAHNSLWRFALATPFFLILLLVILVGNLFNGAVMEVAIPALAQGPLHAGAQGYGFILTGWGAGALLGALLASALGSRINRGYQSILFFTAQIPFIVGIAFSVNTLMAVGCMGVFGLLNSLGNVSFLTLFQRRLPRNLLGRIMGVFTFCNFATLPLSVAVGGFATAHFGASVVIVAGALIQLVAMVIALASRDLRDL
ncbi:MAG TPA: MFS transporter [Ktedonobacterales bacterium]|nr:MFS transporter [Ktedonobacterales bacterium]